ncbi:M15 family metallopeptidase [Butyrivibrio sp. NC3005]|uniref:M15 family metallopeptidase n=1 Tax=Butyrivibrio sp. NC3005 TaxID=1280685 RepID=UPI001FA7CA8C
MLIDNTSCFNYRVIQGTKKLSKHSLGLAIDINPHENPYAKVNKNGSLTIFKKELYEKNSLKKRDSKAHAITKNDLVYKAFKNNGFKWGGNWRTVKDFQHFEQR